GHGILTQYVRLATNKKQGHRTLNRGPFMNLQIAAMFWQESGGLLARIWTYLTQQFTFGRITVSVSSLIVGVLVFMSTMVLGRYASAFFERRIARRGHIDPGLRYTICRLIKYVVFTVGSLAAV